MELLAVHPVWYSHLVRSRAFPSKWSSKISAVGPHLPSASASLGNGLRYKINKKWIIIADSPFEGFISADERLWLCWIWTRNSCINSTLTQVINHLHLHWCDTLTSFSEKMLCVSIFALWKIRIVNRRTRVPPKLKQLDTDSSGGTATLAESILLGHQTLEGLRWERASILPPKILLGIQLRFWIAKRFFENHGSHSFFSSRFLETNSWSEIPECCPARLPGPLCLRNFRFSGAKWKQLWDYIMDLFYNSFVDWNPWRNAWHSTLGNLKTRK